MKKIFLLISLSFISAISFGQTELKLQFEKAVECLKNKDYKKANEEFTLIIEKTSELPFKKFAFIYRGFAKNGLSDFKGAIADFTMAIEADPNDLGSYIDRGQSEIYANDFAAAIKDFEFVLSNDSVGRQGQNALYYMAKIARHENEFALSITYYDRLLALTPNDAELYFERGASKDMILDSQGSIQDYDKAIELKPDYMEAYANRGVAKINLLRKNGHITLTKEQTKDPCADLKKAKQLGDNTIDDMIFVHCGK
jgi:tetratricopeptide (TPR) repeat protein